MFRRRRRSTSRVSPIPWPIRCTGRKTPQGRRSDQGRSNPTRLVVDPQNPDPTVLAQAAAALLAGRLVVVPTETQYGLLASATDTAALALLRRAKGRTAIQPVSVFLDSPDEIPRYARMTAEAGRLARAFLPGPLTLVLEATVAWGEPLVVAGKIGLRVSPLPVILQLVRLVGVPLTATSANRSGMTGSGSVDAIQTQLGASVAIYLDGGLLTGPVSTVVACDSRGMTVLREGAISTSALHGALKEKDGD